MPIYRTLNQDFFKKWSPEMAYVLGFFAADGYMVMNKRGGHFVDFYSTDREIIEGIKNLVYSSHKITTRIPKGSRKIAYRLQIGSKIWHQDLMNLGLRQAKSLILRLPVVPKEYHSHFVRGYFDGDGGVHFGRYWRKDRKKWKWEFTTRFTSGSRKVLKELWLSLKGYISGGYLYNKSGRGFELVFARNDSLALFHFMYDNIGSDIYLRRKYNIFQKAFKILNLGP